MLGGKRTLTSVGWCGWGVRWRGESEGQRGGGGEEDSDVCWLVCGGVGVLEEGERAGAQSVGSILGINQPTPIVRTCTSQIMHPPIHIIKKLLYRENNNKK